jgi:hypothetical protein
MAGHGREPDELPAGDMPAPLMGAGAGTAVPEEL